MSQFKSEQRRLRHHGREFHFVAYEGRVANDRRGETELPAMWFLMNEGKRTAVLPHAAGQPPESLDVQLIGWLDDHVFATGAAQVAEASQNNNSEGIIICSLRTVKLSSMLWIG